MFQLRHRTERPSSSLRKSGSVDDMKIPQILPAVAPSPGKLNTRLISLVIQSLIFRTVITSVVKKCCKVRQLRCVKLSNYSI